MALVKGTLDVLVLKALASQPKHAFEITQWIEARSGGRLMVEDAALMQALHRMEERKLVSASWAMTEKERRARYYRVTAAGRAHYRAESERLTEYADVLVAILGART
ncbi:MAG: helix-turn-helix transcriptional regulator [Gemmatimonadota bacterium]|nr:helix-turn-helix transcriptional regulator [Gemmatimonadota bacterium]